MKYTELVACTIFRNRAVYVSPLGARPFNSTANEKTDPIPLYFAIAVSESNRWQIGRVVRRINSMGCLRLLALRDLEKIKRASNEIRRIGGELDERFQNQTMEVRHKEEEIARARDRLAALKGEMDRIGNDIVGHLPYRIYRAKFRSEQFQRQVDDLFVNRIEGWQPYDEFVRRRLYPTYDFIARVGERYDRLNRNYQNQLLSLDSEMQSVSSSHLVEIQSDILRSHSFQHFIETIALAYYGGYLAYFLSKPYYKELAAVAKPYVPFSMADLPEGLLSLRTYATTEDEHKAFVFACSTTIALLRLWYNVRQHKKKLQVFDERTSHIIKKHA
ncbi:MAG: DUF3422 family protein [Paracoccaceae bacterium]|nr:DUF3422 family protein [Paracoccaceae bacterium]